MGIPRVIDGLVQQAILQVLDPIFDPTFSQSSYGFRPGRSAHQALLAAREYVREGHEIVVDIDVEKFFDRVNHDKLMSRLAKRIKDKRLLRIIRRFLEAGVMQQGVCLERLQGLAQGGLCKVCIILHAMKNAWFKEIGFINLLPDKAMVKA